MPIEPLVGAIDTSDNAARIVAALLSLGDTADRIAGKLQELGIGGVPQEANSCPLAFFLAVSGVPHCRVGGDTCYYRNAGHEWRQVNLPNDALHQFVWRFDTGHYPFLELDFRAYAAQYERRIKP